MSIVLALTTALGTDSSLSSARPRSTLAAPLAGPMAVADNSIILLPLVTGLSAPVHITHAGDGPAGCSSSSGAG